MPPEEKARALPIVGVMGSGEHAHEDLAGPLGKWLASQAVHLLTGGGSGVMAAVSRAFHAVEGRQGLTIGVLPCGKEARTLPAGYPNPWIEIPIHTHLPRAATPDEALSSRNPINILSARVVVALPGSTGTASEVELALSYNRPVIAFVHARTDIPKLPKEVQTTDDLAQVKKFVRTNI